MNIYRLWLQSRYEENYKDIEADDVGMSVGGCLCFYKNRGCVGADGLPRYACPPVIIDAYAKWTRVKLLQAGGRNDTPSE